MFDRHIRLLLSGSLAAALASTLCVASFAQTTPRTTPVEVKSPVAIDQTNNTVKAQQSGAWNVSVVGTSGVSVTNTPSVNVANSPNVSVTNTPNVTVTNSPTVKIDGTSNTVTCATRHSTVPLWTGFQYVNSNSVLFCRGIDCRGYKEARIMLTKGLCSVDPTKISIGINAYTPAGATKRLGGTTWSSSATQYDGQGGFVFDSTTCVFSIPIMSDTMDLFIANSDTIQLVLDGNCCWIYLVN